jgi:hypothetical protein
MLRLGASLGRIPSAYKVEIGDWMLQQIMAILPAPKPDPKTAATYARYLWALARVGARQSLQSSAHESPPSKPPSAGWRSYCSWTGAASNRPALPPPTSRARISGANRLTAAHARFSALLSAQAKNSCQ